MFGTKIGISALDAVATCVGGYFLVQEVTKVRWITLAKANEDGYKGENDKNKFGYRFRDWMVSTTSEENKEFWEERIQKISSLKNGSKLKTDGYLNEVTSKVDAWKSEDTDKNTKMNEAITTLKKQCKARYDDASATSSNYPKSDKGKWDEIWNYCSIASSNLMQFKDA